MTATRANHIHPTAIIEDGVELGAGTAVWDNVHLRTGARIGADCIIGEKTYVAGNARIGDLCKLNAGVYVCAGVTIGRGVMIAAQVVFTNERNPRAADPELTDLLPSEPTINTLSTTVEDGATIGSGTTIGPGLTLGAFCMVGMGSVVTHDVPAHALVAGNPARVHGIVCRCGETVARGTVDELEAGDHPCDCGRVVPWGP